MVLDIHSRYTGQCNSASFVKILNVYVHLLRCGSAQCVLDGELICTSLGTITTYGSHMLQQHCDVVFNKVTSQEGLWLNLLFAWGVRRAVEEVCPLSFQRNLDEKGCLFLNVFLVILKMAFYFSIFEPYLHIVLSKVVFSTSFSSLRWVGRSAFFFVCYIFTIFFVNISDNLFSL